VSAQLTLAASSSCQKVATGTTAAAAKFSPTAVAQAAHVRCSSDPSACTSGKTATIDSSYGDYSVELWSSRHPALTGSRARTGTAS